jgi:integrase
MARTVRDARLETRAAREKLKARSKPYYKALDEGLHLGYRKGATSGKWVVRLYVGDGVYKVETIGIADDKADAGAGEVVLDFRQAQARAREKHVEQARVAKGLPADGRYTVAHCLEEYTRFLEAERKSAEDARYRINALILPALGDVLSAELTKEQIEAWRNEIARTAPRVRTKKGAKQQYRDFDPDDGAQHRRRRAAANRTMTVLKAALNRAWRDGKIPSDSVWRRVERFEDVDAARVRYLSIDEARRLINASQGEFRDLVRGALATGCRLGELAALEVADFNADSGTLRIRYTKTGRSRHVVLNDEGIALFTRLTAGRSGSELMLRKADGAPWGKNSPQKPIAAACAAARIDPPANFHCLRHTYASHAVMAGAPLIVVAKNLGHADTKMVEKHYGHLSTSYFADAIRRAAPRFGSVPDDGKVASIVPAR